MPPGVLDARALNRALLQRQDLLARGDTPAIEMVERLVGMQAQEPENPYVGLRSRLRDFRAEQLSELIAGRRAVRAQLMRSTIHLVSARDCLAIHPRGLAGPASRQRSFARRPGASLPRGVRPRDGRRRAHLVGAHGAAGGRRAPAQRLRTFRDESGREALDAPGAPLPDRDTPAPPRFLPEYDNVALAHADRSRIFKKRLTGPAVSTRQVARQPALRRVLPGELADHRGERCCGADRGPLRAASGGPAGRG
jgi:hypothetical protein